MSGKLKRTLCLLCVFLIALSSFHIVPPAAGEELTPENEEVERIYNLGTGSGENPTSGLFVLTGTDVPLETAPVAGEEEYAPIPDETGKDAFSPEAVLSTAGGAPGSSVVAPTVGPSVRVSESSVSLKTGETVSVTVSVGGYPSGAYLQASNGNEAAFSCVWGDWRGESIPLRVTGKNGGSGSITFRLMDSQNSPLASATLSVTVLQSLPTLVTDAESVSLNVGTSGTITATVRNYSGGGFVSASADNASVCEVETGSWSGWNLPVTVRGKSAGVSKVTLTLYNSLRTELASASFTVSVSDAASVTVSPDAPKLTAGESFLLTVKVNGAVSAGDYLQYTLSNPTAFGAAWFGSWSGNAIKLNLAGKNAGSGTLTVTLRNRAGTKLAAASVPVEVSARDNPQLSVTPSSVRVTEGQSVSVNCTGRNISDTFCLRYVNRAPSLFQCVWQSDWSGNSLPLTIKGKSAGSGLVTVELLVNSVVRASATIEVEVVADNGGGGGSGGGEKTEFPSYNFANYSRPGISLALCQYMFGKTQRAQTVHDWDIGNGGVCFGMTASVGLLSAASEPNPGTFGQELISKLAKSDYSSDLRLSVSDFVEVMHVSQVAYSMKESSGLSNLVEAVREGGTSQPVIVCLRGPGGGHAVLGIGVTDSGSVRVYDSNWPGQERVISINGKQWSYNLWDGLTWGSGNGKITYIPYSVYSDVWDGHGFLQGVRLQDGGPLQDEENRYLFSTSADNFTLLDFYDTPVARYVDGVLEEKAEGVEEVFLDNASPDGSFQNLHMLYVPEDLYTVRNESGKSVMVSLSGLALSVCVTSESEEFTLAVSDEEEFANAFLTPEEGEPYSISVGSSREGEPDKTTIRGVGNDETICMGIGDGGLGMGLEGLFISNGASDGALSLNAMETVPGDDAQETAFRQDFTLNSTNIDMEYPVTAWAGEGGVVSPAGVTSVPEGASQSYRIQPLAGYTLKAVYVNGVEASYSDEESAEPQYSYYDGAYEYAFRDVTEPCSLYAEFAKDLNACEVYVDGQGNPIVTDPDKAPGEQELMEGADYIWSLSHAEEGGETRTYIVLQAVSGSDYSGVLMEPYEEPEEPEQPAEPALTDGAYDAESKELRLTVANADSFALTAAVYASGDAGQAGKLLSFIPADEIRTLDATADGVPARVPLDDASLPESYVVRVFLLRDLESLFVAARPMTISVGP